MVRYYGFYSNKSRGLRKKAATDDQVPALIESEISSKEFRKNWARLIQKIYNVNPLLCPKCLGFMKIISFIEDDQVISKILKHLGLWEVKQRPPPRANAPHPKIYIDYTDSQIPSDEDDLSLYRDPDLYAFGVLSHRNVCLIIKKSPGNSRDNNVPNRPKML
jgi:hypothetical protein